MEFKDYYQILGVPQTASQEDIKKTYRKLARKYHPDVSKEMNAEERFKEIQEAYDTLGDAEKRAQYDALYEQVKSGGFKQQTFSGKEGEAFDFNLGAGDLGDLFETLFGGRFTQKGGRDIHLKIQLTLEEAVMGTTKTISLPKGAAKPTVDVRIPKGVRSGQTIRVPGAGFAGAPADNLYLEVVLLPHPYFSVDEHGDIYLDLPITPWEAALGAGITVPIIGGKVELKIPAGSQTGRKLRLKGKGLGAPPGHQYVVLQIMIPPADSEEKKSFYRDMAQKMPFNPRAHLGV
jgi:curved DNA-binding protein